MTSQAWFVSRFGPGWSRPTPNEAAAATIACKVFPNSGGNPASRRCSVKVAGIFDDCRHHENFRELQSRKIVVGTENSYLRGFVDDCSLSLIVCGVCR